MNEILLTGYLVRGIEVEEVGRRHVVGRTLIVVPRGSSEGGCDFIRLVMWDGAVADVARCGGPGARVRVLGRLHSCDAGNGENGQSLAVMVKEVAPMICSPADERAYGEEARDGDEPQLPGGVWGSVAAVDAAELRPAAESPGRDARACSKRSSRGRRDPGEANGVVGCE
jgi:single-stranded DNA-binding protein